jgi:hypothetical protein
MTESQNNSTNKTPVHLWIMGVIALVWNLIGAMDYVMTQMQNENYMSTFTPEQLDFFYSIPSWAVATWAIGVWGGVVGSVFLLIRNKLAVWIFIISLIAMTITSFQNYVLSNGLEVVGSAFSVIFTAIIFIVALCLCFYAKAMHKNGVLK